MPEVCARVRRQVVISEAAADVDRYRGIRHAVVKGGRIGISVKVDRMLLKQIRTHDHANVGERQEEFVILINGHQRGRNIAVHHADVHDRAGINVPIVGRWRRIPRLYIDRDHCPMQSTSGVSPTAPSKLTPVVAGSPGIKVPGEV